MVFQLVPVSETGRTPKNLFVKSRLTTMTCRWVLALAAFIAYVLAQEQALFNPKHAYQRISGGGPTLPVDLEQLYNDRGFGVKVNESNFDGYNSM
jgi:hypothetical protein